jgi:hypothetical protein
VTQQPQLIKNGLKPTDKLSDYMGERSKTPSFPFTRVVDENIAHQFAERYTWCGFRMTE